MTSFNDNDGAPSTGNTFILKDVLRGEWGFDGIVVSDWASVAEMMAHGFAADSKEAAMKAVNAGVDMEMVSYTFVKELPELIKEGKVKKSAIDDAVRNILRIKFRLGLFDNPYVDEKRIEELYAPSHLEAAKQAAVESAILLKNEKETLPLQSSVKAVAVVGPMANAPYDQLGTWVFDGDKTKTVTPLKAIKELVGDKVQVIYEPGLTYSRDKNMAGVAKAAAAAARADVFGVCRRRGYSFRRGALPGRPEPARCAKRTDCRFGENRKTGGYCRNGRASVDHRKGSRTLVSCTLFVPSRNHGRTGIGRLAVG